MGQSCCATSVMPSKGQIDMEARRIMENSRVVLYMHELSMPCRAIKSLLLAGDVRFEEKIINPFNGELKSPEILKLNPAGSIPFITVNGVPYLESQAIMRFLCQVKPSLAAYYPVDPFKKHEVDALLDFNGTEFRPKSIKPIQLKMEINQLKDKKQDRKSQQNLHQQYKESLDAMAQIYQKLDNKLEGKVYLLGDQPTIADFQIGAQALDYNLLGLSYKDFPNVNRWKSRLLLKTKGFMEVHNEYFKTLDKYSTVQLEPMTTKMRYNWDTQKINAILSSWYPDNWDRHFWPNDKAIKMWFYPGEEVDAHLKQNYSEDLKNLAKGNNEHWKEDHLGALAYIILCDQIARNIHRNNAKAFEYDIYSLVAAKEIIANSRKYNSYRWFEKFTIMLTLIRSEDLNDAHMYFDLVNQARIETQDLGLDYVSEFFKNAYMQGYPYIEPLQKFGRYPTRNHTLQRKSDQFEIKYLKTVDAQGRQILGSTLSTQGQSFHATTGIPRPKLIYFDLHGRALQCRMLLWYCGVEFDDKRIQQSQYPSMKKNDELMENQGLPQLILHDGQMMAQTMSIVRYIGSTYRGQNLQRLYPGTNDMDASFAIDELQEWSSDFLGGYNFFSPGFPGYDKRSTLTKQYMDGAWTQALQFLNNTLKKNVNSNFLVGDHMTVADITIGAHFLKLCYNRSFPDRALFQKSLKKYSQVLNWAENTICGSFKEWFDTQPKNQGIM